MIAPTLSFDIYMAGDFAVAKQVCREFCFANGECVHVEPLAYVYTGGEEAGFKVGFINYPRFPRSADVLKEAANKLANLLMERLCQHSYSIVGPETTEWISRRASASNPAT